jgi:hypothetical protein
MNVIDFEVEDGATARGGLVRGAKHQADVAALEEGEIPGVEEELHTEGVLVKTARTREVVDGDGDLTYLFEIDEGRGDVGVTHERPPGDRAIDHIGQTASPRSFHGA